jgi:hypothetical protein
VIAALSSLANSLIIRAFSYTQGNISQAVGRTNGYERQTRHQRWGTGPTETLRSLLAMSCTVSAAR